MLAIIKEIGIFVIVAQAILYFVPKETYVKYVKVLIGIMMIAKIVSPVFSLLSGEAWEEIAFQGDVLEKQLEEQQETFRGNDGYDNVVRHYSQIAEQQGRQQHQMEAGDE